VKQEALQTPASIDHAVMLPDEFVSTYTAPKRPGVLRFNFKPEPSEMENAVTKDAMLSAFRLSPSGAAKVKDAVSLVHVPE
jgi:hypothetical protein